MKQFIISIGLIFCSLITFSQGLFFTRNGQISFFSKTSMENIDAVNNEVTSILDSQKGEVVFAVLIKSFRFEKALMEEHFNENYLESDKFPKATFNGKITDLPSISFTKNGSYPIAVEGDMNIHNVTKKIAVQGTLTVAGSNVTVNCKFNVKLADYNIKIPSLVAEKISETIDVTVNCQYTPKK